MTVTIEMFKTEQCGRCPDVLELLEEIESEHDVELEVIDAAENRTRALAANVFSVPAVVIDEDTKLTGVPTKDDLLNAIDE